VKKRVISRVAFFGYADAKPKSELYQRVYKTAQLLAGKDFTIVNGGGPGVMDASTKGAESVDGDTVAVTFYPEDAPGFEGRYVANVVDREIVTGNYIERMFKLLEVADIYIIFKGGTGTVSEFATAWALSRLYYGHHKPFLLYGDFWREVMDLLRKEFFMRGSEGDVYRIVDSPKDVLNAVKEFENQFQEHDAKTCDHCQKRANIRYKYRR
jgi:uncharacterized protein (TIGR00725 family)